MRDETEIRVHFNSTQSENVAMGAAIAAWLDIATTFNLRREIRIDIAGGPYLSADETKAIWRQLIPPNAVEDVLVDGESWNEADTDIPPDLGDAQSATFDTVAVVP